MASLISGATDNAGFMWQDRLIGIAKFVIACLHKMKAQDNGYAGAFETLNSGKREETHLRVEHLISLVWLEEM